jgi:hypothetical protein
MSDDIYLPPWEVARGNWWQDSHYCVRPAKGLMGEVQ